MKFFKNILLIIVIYFYSKISFTQSCSILLSNEIKSTEVYNHLFYKKYGYNFSGVYSQYGGEYNAFTYYFNNFNVNGPEMDKQLGNLEPASYMIESLIIMYETTKDKAYLIKAINKSIEQLKQQLIKEGK